MSTTYVGTEGTHGESSPEGDAAVAAAQAFVGVAPIPAAACLAIAAGIAALRRVQTTGKSADEGAVSSTGGSPTSSSSSAGGSTAAAGSTATSSKTGTTSDGAADRGIASTSGTTGRDANFKTSVRVEIAQVKRDVRMLEVYNREFASFVRTECGGTPVLFSSRGALRANGCTFNPEFKYNKKDRDLLKSDRAAFNSARVAFLKDTATKYRDLLVEAGITETQIAGMLEGSVPEGWQVHHREPLDDNGTNAIKNLILLRDRPEHRATHGYYNPAELLARQMEPGETRTVALTKFPDLAIYPIAKRGLHMETYPIGRYVEMMKRAASIAAELDEETDVKQDNPSNAGFFF